MKQQAQAHNAVRLPKKQKKDIAEHGIIRM